MTRDARAILPRRRKPHAAIPSGAGHERPLGVERRSTRADLKILFVSILVARFDPASAKKDW
jgi:hypothetical protein